MIVYLKYGIFSGVSLNWSVQEIFNTLEFADLPETERVSGRSLRKIEYSHCLSRRKVIKITISADELINGGKMDFCREFFLAHAWKISLDNWVSEMDVILSEQGMMPNNPIDNNKYLPEISFTLIEKYPRV